MGNDDSTIERGGPAVMGFHNGVADRESNSDPFGLGGKEWFENLIRLFSPSSSRNGQKGRLTRSESA
jgi:hypothetical protein